MRPRGIMPNKDGRIRTSMEITEGQNQMLSKLVPWGLKRAVMDTMINLVLEKLEVHGEVFIGPFIAGKMKLVVRNEERDGELKRY